MMRVLQQVHSFRHNDLELQIVPTADVSDQWHECLARCTVGATRITGNENIELVQQMAADRKTAGIRGTLV